MMPFAQWLERGTKKKPRKRLPRMSERRKKEARIYAVKRKAFLEDHPECMAREAIAEWTYVNDPFAWNLCPWYESAQSRSIEIHHTKKPRSKYLNDESTWLAVSRWSHDWIENNKKAARSIGLLQ
jgi:hypothetical protein